MRISMNSYEVPKFFSSLKLGDQHDAIEELMSLSPYEMRNLLHHIMAGDEFHIDVQHSVSHSFYNVVSDREAGVSKVSNRYLKLSIKIILFNVLK